MVVEFLAQVGFLNSIVPNQNAIAKFLTDDARGALGPVVGSVDLRVAQNARKNEGIVFGEIKSGLRENGFGVLTHFLV